MTTDFTRLSAFVSEPQKQNQRASLHVSTCKMKDPKENCPFLKKRQCLHKWQKPPQKGNGKHRLSL